MNRRSLLDYLAENNDSEAAAHVSQTAESLERRLAELEARLSAAARMDEPAVQDQPFSHQIESILKRPQGHLPQKRIEPQETRSRLPAELPPAPDYSADFAKFVEAVHLIGRAANRFLQEPPRPLAAREPAEPSQDTLMLTAALKETIAAFQAMTSNLATAAEGIRRAAEPPKIEPPKVEPPLPRRHSREEGELVRLQDDLERLRERLTAATRPRSRDSY
jgi:hypothetical protein